IGADASRIKVTGNLKFDSVERPGSAMAGRGRERVLRYFRITSNRPIIVAGSTVAGEEEIVLEAVRRVKSRVGNPLVVIAPRKPERFGEVAQLVRDRAFVTTRRTDLPIDSEPRGEVVGRDTGGGLRE